MSKLLNTMDFFKEIAKIPRESGNEKKIAEYLVQFAKKRNLFYKCDEYNNVLIKKKTCDKEPIILQAHTDMVCEKEDTKKINFATEPIEVIEKNGYLMANGTTLGADNGIGVAQILAILDSDISCNIEAIFTVSEETTMIGAMKFDTNDIESKALLSLDGFEENTILIESACFYDIILQMQYTFGNPINKNAYEIKLTGMLGGHSGFDIDKNRGNSNIELAKIINKINDIEIINFFGGNKFNVIPSEANVQFYTNLSNDEICNLCKNTQSILTKQYETIEISCTPIKTEENALDNKQSKKFMQTIMHFPHGVVHKNQMKQVTTSINLGGVNLRDKELKVGMRSSRKQEEQKCIEIIKEYSKENELILKILGSQPGFESKKDSNLIQSLLKSHPIELFNKKPELKSVHITVEAGIFQSKISGLQIAIISPNIQGAHTINEKVEIESIIRMNEWLTNFLKYY